MRKFILSIVTLLASVAIFAQSGLSGALGDVDNTPTINWKSTIEKVEGDLYKVIFSGKIQQGWHTYDLNHEYSATVISFEGSSNVELVGEPVEISKAVESEGEKHFYNEYVIEQKVKLTKESGLIKGEIEWRSCKGDVCASPEYYEFNIKLDGASKEVSTGIELNQNTGTLELSDADVSNGESISSNSGEPTKKSNFDWSLIIEAILWGFAMVLTPCVFPMVPMTVSFFMKGSSTKAQGRFKASMYGLFIVLLYTVPISVIIMLTRFIGGDAVTADIFNWLATHWLPNILFFLIFMVFAVSFFGAFEFKMPAALVNKSDQGADKGGLIGIFFMALTLVLVSFSCTGPIVGTVLIKSTQGEFWTPMITMLAFSVAFALPFTLVAFFPSLLNDMKKSSGGWLNSVKVTLGFIEVALGLKFLSVADQTYHWGILDREVYLAIWIVVFSLLGFYLLGKIRFVHDEVVEKLSVKRFALAVVVFSFVVYLIPGMFGAPLKALAGYLPPMSTHDFVITQGEQKTSEGLGKKYNLHLPHGLTGYFSLEEGLEAAQKTGKPIFVDITGHGCVNCREMEARVWSDPEVLRILNEEYIIVALYTDDKVKLKEEDWIIAENGIIYKELGRANSYIARSRFGVNAQPNYILLSPEGEQIAPARGYDLSIPGFIEFLKSGL